MPPLLLDLAYIPLAILYLPWLLYQMLVLKKNRRGWGERFGFIKRRLGPNRKPCIWIHAVSLGEVNATRSLVTEIERRLPAYDIVISTTTDTGYAAARRHYPAKQVFRYPLDFSFVVGRVLDRIRPDAIVLMELEVWPNFVRLARRRGIPVGIGNGRVTEERSMRRFRKPLVRGLTRRMFAGITWTAAQNETYAARFEELGIPKDRIAVTGTMKYDTAIIADSVPGDDRLARALGIDSDRPLFVAGSTGPGEEELLLTSHSELRSDHPDLQLAIIPRKPERFDEVARLVEARGFECRRRSHHPDSTSRRLQPARTGDDQEGGDAAASNDRITVILGDTMGELRKFYALADAVFVGRSLVPMGGSDLMEAAGLGCPMCFGPHVENFADVAEQLIRANAAVQLDDPRDLAPTLRRFLEDREGAHVMGRMAQDVVRRNTGATAKTVDLLCKCLGRRANHPASSISTEKLR
ncbi:MAG: 3-deoxy-D-manno-octulosonic acid transferase [Phycisphaerae bacterium]|nr:3-deoxy-D-manno-octulosonic acid transferase [Phycisphaerae bacterium]